MIKRTIDVMGAIFGLVVLAPVTAAVAIAVRLSLGPPVIFRQLRAGRDGVPFTLYKFRTMTNAPEAPDAERLTRLGKFLRHSSLDELPQFWNVLRGEMSLVGPRPLLPEYTELYTPTQARRLEVRPGVTSLVAVKGRNAVSWDRQLELDAWYVANRTLLLDLKILALTVLKVLKREGITQAGHATRDSFRGADSV